MSFLRPLRLGLFLACGLLAACQTFSDGDRRLREQTDRLLADSLEQARRSQTPPPAVQAALLPPLLPASALPAGGPRFDVAVRDMEAREFFLSLMDSAGQNLVVHPDVSGTITFSLRNVTLEEVLRALRDSYGYDYRRTSYGYQISPNSKQVRTYKLNYLDLEREGSADTRVSSGQVVSSDSASASSVGTVSSSSSTTLDASRVSTRTRTDVWATTRDAVAMIIGVSPSDASGPGAALADSSAPAGYAGGNCRADATGNSVCFNSMSGVLVVRASVDDHQRVEEFIATVERNLQRQVVLEAKILEVRLGDGFQAGIDWRRMGSKLTLGVAAENLVAPAGVGGVFSAAYSGSEFNGVLELLETQGQVRVLSSPRVSTLNNQKAVIKVGTDEFFVTDVSTTTTTLSGGTTAPDLDITLTPFFSGISLDVTPQINDREVVTLHVRPTISRVQDQEKRITLGSDSSVFVLPLALSNTRQSDSIVRARSGQVVVIGGLLENSSDNLDVNVPWLSRLPFLGVLFQQQRKALERTELVILLRPQVVGADTWLDELQRNADSFRELR